ncbi:MAG TPA: STAS domain-containing protein [Frankiaceae bacterium]|nr:STAS domain-containing protein [Frankiaceae bacterium]
MPPVLTRASGVVPVPATVTSRSVGEVMVLRCAGDLDLAAVEPVTAAVMRALETRPVGLVLDLSGVAFCDTVGLRLLMSAASRARLQGCAATLAAVQPQVAEFLARVCVDRTLTAYADVSAAIEGLMFSATWR